MWTRSRGSRQGDTGPNGTQRGKGGPSRGESSRRNTVGGAGSGAWVPRRRAGDSQERAAVTQDQESEAPS